MFRHLYTGIAHGRYSLFSANAPYLGTSQAFKAAAGRYSCPESAGISTVLVHNGLVVRCALQLVERLLGLFTTVGLQLADHVVGGLATGKKHAKAGNKEEIEQAFSHFGEQNSREGPHYASRSFCHR